MYKSILTGLWFLVAALMFQTSASAQLAAVTGSGASDRPAVEDISNLSEDEIRDLMSRLSDNEVRAILIKQLETAASRSQSETAGKAASFEFWRETATGIAYNIHKAIRNIPQSASVLYQGFSNFFAQHTTEGIFWFIGIILVALAAGLIAEFLTNKITIKWHNKIRVVQADANLTEVARLLGLRLFLELLGLFVFFLVCDTILQIFMPDEFASATELLVTNFVVFPRLVAALGRFLMSPQRPDLRIVHTDDKTAIFMQKSQIRLTLLLGATYWLAHFLLENNVPVLELRLIFWPVLAFYLGLIFITYKARQGLTLMMAGKPESGTPQKIGLIARAYPWFLIIIVALAWLLVEALVYHQAWDLLAGQVEATLIILALAPAFDTGIRGLVKHLVKPKSGEGEIAEQAFQSAKKCYFRIGRVIVFGLAVLLIARIWHIDFSQLAAAGVGARAAAALFQFLLVAAFGYLVWEIVTLWINRKLAAELTASGIEQNNEEPGGGEGGGAGASRLSTVLPLIRLCLQSAIIVITLLIALGEVGIEITPLLAGAGIIGLAVGFGAQKLVADVVSGIFFLVDDAFRAGEYVEIDGTFGTVEKISLRSLQLRHHKGPVHTIPYGEIPKITNFSRDWVIVKLRFTVPFDTDLHKVKKQFKKIGAEMMDVPEFAEDFLQPFKSQGVLEVNDVGIVVRGKFMAKPGTQFVLRKEVYARVQKAFEENGLQFARKEVRVKIDGDPDNLTEEDKQQIAAAASEASDDAENQDPAAKPSPA